MNDGKTTNMPSKRDSEASKSLGRIEEEFRDLEELIQVWDRSM